MSPQVKGLRERKKEEKLARIEAAARELFSERGYDKTTTRAIAEAAGIGTGTLFNYFPEKRDLLLHLFSKDVSVVKQRTFDDLPDGALVDRLMFVFGRFYEYYATDPGLSRVFIKEIGWVTDSDRMAMASLTFDLIGSLANVLAEAQQTGEIDRRFAPQAIAMQVFSLYTASLTGWLGGMVPESSVQLAMLRGGLEMLYRGLAPRKEEP